LWHPLSNADSLIGRAQYVAIADLRYGGPSLWRTRIRAVALQIQMHRAMRFVTCNNKRDFQTHSSSLVFVHSWFPISFPL